MQNKTNEELAEMLLSGVEDERIYLQLLYNLKPMIRKIAETYLKQIPIYDREDYYQEGLILIWKLISKKRYTPGTSFSNLFYTAFQMECINLFRNYVLKNLIVISETEDLYNYGYQTSTLVEAEYAKIYREKKRLWDKRLYERNHPKVEKPVKPKLTEEEKRKHRKEYYEKNKERYKRLKKEWYQKNHEYALQYQKAYEAGYRSETRGKNEYKEIALKLKTEIQVFGIKPEWPESH